MTRSARWVGLVAFVVGGLAQLWAHHANVVFAFWDAQAHLDIARRVIDSTTPGLQMLGTVWLPVPHLLLLLPVQVDAWWWNGLAGGLVGLAAFTTIAVGLHDILARRLRDPRWAWLGVAFVVLNPSLLFLQTTAMTEPVLLAFLVAATALLDRWIEAGSTSLLVGAGLVTALAVGSRYDGWFFAAVAVLVVAWHARRNGRSPVGAVLSFIAPTALVVIAWLAFNYAYFGDPLEFQRGAWSAQSQQAALAGQGLLPTRGRPDLALAYYLGAAALACGVVLIVGALAASWSALRSRGAAATTLLGAALWFNVIALVAGQSVIALPWTEPAGFLNVRYGVMLLPAAAAALLLGLDHAGRSRQSMLRAALVALSLQVALFALVPRLQVGALSEGLAIRDGDPRQQDASDWLRDHYDGGRVLVDGAINISPRTRVPLRDRIHEWTWELGAKALAAPELAVEWVVADARTPDDAVSRAIGKRPDFRKRFDLVFDQDGLEIWRRR
ncbi:MAG: phospholipid carrier-dependent glycosyltransferase [Gemmatimonadales bacterium]|nr:phospholipid carrier-dependent glycosyltransferase [Gemmatimonadales bacterium]